MNRFSRISTIWRKEFADTLRDRRTLVAMVLVPMVLYPALMLGSLQAFELQVSKLKQQEYSIAVASDEVRHWLQTRILDPDLARFAAAAGLPAEELPAAVEAAEKEADAQSGDSGRGRLEKEEAAVHRRPPPYRLEVVSDVRLAVATGMTNVGLLVSGELLPTPDSAGACQITLVMDKAEIRSQFAASALEGVFKRLSERVVARRLQDLHLTRDYIEPYQITQLSVATPEKLGGSIIGQIVALILVVMTITGAIYPAIDLTAGERERGTLETLMAAPVPKVDLIAGKFVVVASIGMLSAVLNLLSIGGTVYLGGLGDVLTKEGGITIPLRTLPLVLVTLIPLAVMFSAVLLAVCSFARSFKEAQNYIMPVMVVALIPAVVGLLPGTELEGPLLIMPVTNIVILTRELFMGEINRLGVLWVTLSTCIYALAAVGVAAKLFGQEAVLFADSASIRTLLKRKFFKPSNWPSASQALLLMAVVYLLNFFIQQSLFQAGLTPGSPEHLAGFALTLVLLLAALPIGVALYTRVRITTAFSFSPPRWRGLAAGLCIGLSTWVLALVWMSLQERILPLPPDFKEAAAPYEQMLQRLSVATVLFFFAILPAFCEELFFRGYALSGLRHVMGKTGAVLLVAFAFGMTHMSIQRLPLTAAVGALLGLLVIRWGSIWPAVLAHVLHNSIILLITREDGLLPLLKRAGFVDPVTEDVFPPLPWIVGAAVLLLAGLALCVKRSRPVGQLADGLGQSGGDLLGVAGQQRPAVKD
jgi:sodium transport system permease protein